MAFSLQHPSDLLISPKDASKIKQADRKLERREADWCASFEYYIYRREKSMKDE